MECLLDENAKIEEIKSNNNYDINFICLILHQEKILKELEELNKSFNINTET